MAHDGQCPGDGQEAAENWPQILYDYVFRSEIRERKTARVGAEIQAERKDHLNDAGTGFLELENSSPKQISEDKAHKAEALGEVKGKHRGDAMSGLSNHSIRKSSRTEKQ